MISRHRSIPQIIHNKSCDSIHRSSNLPHGSNPGNSSNYTNNIILAPNCCQQYPNKPKMYKIHSNGLNGSNGIIKQSKRCKSHKSHKNNENVLKHVRNYSIPPLLNQVAKSMSNSMSNITNITKNVASIASMSNKPSNDEYGLIFDGSNDNYNNNLENK